MKNKLLILILVLLTSCEKNKKYIPKQTLQKKYYVVKKIALSTNNSYQSFIVSGDSFKFETNELTFNIKDTIAIQGDLIYPKNDTLETIIKI